MKAVKTDLRPRKGGEMMTKNEMLWLARLIRWLKKEGYTPEKIDELLQYIAFGIEPGE